LLAISGIAWLDVAPSSLDAENNGPVSAGRWWESNSFDLTGEAVRETVAATLHYLLHASVCTNEENQLEACIASDVSRQTVSHPAEHDYPHRAAHFFLILLPFRGLLILSRFVECAREWNARGRSRQDRAWPENQGRRKYQAKCVLHGGDTLDLTRDKISCGESSGHATERRRTTADLLAISCIA
jgi:hypothetical protein